MIAAEGILTSPRRQDLARRRRRPRHGQDLCLRRRGARGRHQAAPADRRRDRHRGGRRRLRSTAPPARCTSVRSPSSRPRSSSTSRAGCTRAPTTPTNWSPPCTGSWRTPTGVRRLRVRANADNAEDALRARRFGAQGIGLCRTEHMFLGERREMVEKLILADTDDGARGRAGRAAAAAEGGLHRAVRGDGRTARHRPAARPAAARVPARHHRAVGTRRARRVPQGRQRERPAPAPGRAQAARAEPDAGSARRTARPGHPRPVRDAGTGDRRGRRASARTPRATRAPRS